MGCKLADVHDRLGPSKSREGRLNETQKQPKDAEDADGFIDR